MSFVTQISYSKTKEFLWFCTNAREMRWSFSYLKLSNKKCCSGVLFPHGDDDGISLNSSNCRLVFSNGTEFLF
jgi:hypothetical protein